MTYEQTLVERVMQLWPASCRDTKHLRAAVGRWLELADRAEIILDARQRHEWMYWSDAAKPLYSVEDGDACSWLATCYDRMTRAKHHVVSWMYDEMLKHGVVYPSDVEAYVSHS